MANIKNGIMGPFNGAVGTVIGGTWRGINYMRSRPVPRNKKPPSPKQLDQRNKMTLISPFAYSLSSLLDLSFKKYAIGKTGTNCAASHMLKEAITGSSPAFMIDFSKVLISKGALPGVAAPAADAMGEGNLVFTWMNNTEQEGAKSNDRAIVAVYCPALKQSVYSTIGAARAGGTCILNVRRFIGYEVHTYLGFITEDGEEASDSVYIGMVTVH